jgi:hypothetical protein
MGRSVVTCNQFQSAGTAEVGPRLVFFCGFVVFMDHICGLQSGRTLFSACSSSQQQGHLHCPHDHQVETRDNDAVVPS